MANTTLVFHGTERSGTDQTKLMCYKNTHNNIFIKIEDGVYEPAFICLDKNTAIKLHRELKKHISFLEEEVNNG